MHALFSAEGKCKNLQPYTNSRHADRKIFASLGLSHYSLLAVLLLPSPGILQSEGQSSWFNTDGLAAKQSCIEGTLVLT